MKQNLKTLAGILGLSFTAQAAYQSNLSDDISNTKNLLNSLDNNVEKASILNLQVSDLLASHRSHSSHSSHRSSSGGSYSSSGYSGSSNYSYTPSTYQAPKIINETSPSKEKNVNKSIPLKNDYSNDKNKREKLIRQVQTVLLLEGLYEGSIDGIMGETTRNAITSFKKKHNINSESYLGIDTLNALGIKGF